MIDDPSKEIVSAHWGHPRAPETNFFTFGPTRNYLQRCVTGRDGHASEDWWERWVVETFLADKLPLPECLSLCCGFGDRDRRLARMGVFTHCTGIDLSEGAITHARRRASAEGYGGITYVVGDLDTIELPGDRYDLVYAGGALHHIARLEHVVTQIARCLRPGGYLVSDEYIGPPYNDLSFRQREIVNAAIHLLPRRLRHATEDSFVPQLWRTPLWRRALFELGRLVRLRPPTIDFDSVPLSPTWPWFARWGYRAGQVMQRWLSSSTVPDRRPHFGQVWDVCPDAIRRQDPSEGVRSDEILPLIRSVFPEVTVRYFNGSVLNYALDGTFYRNYDPAKDRPLLELLFHLEECLIESGELPQILAGIVARKAIANP